MVHVVFSKYVNSYLSILVVNIDSVIKNVLKSKRCLFLFLYRIVFTYQLTIIIDIIKQVFENQTCV